MTGLQKVCPRCGRVGSVSVSDYGDFVIDWPARPASESQPRDPPRRDTCLSLDDLLRPSMGCGYDARQHAPRFVERDGVSVRVDCSGTVVDQTEAT